MYTKAYAIKHLYTEKAVGELGLEVFLISVLKVKHHPQSIEKENPLKSFYPKPGSPFHQPLDRKGHNPEDDDVNDDQEADKGASRHPHSGDLAAGGNAFRQLSARTKVASEQRGLGKFIWQNEYRGVLKN